MTASEQTAGRGRQGRRWSAPPGSSLLASLVLRPAPRLLPLPSAVAVCDAVDAAPARRARAARIKWPNDVVLARGEQLAKLAGILIEARPQQGWAVLGYRAERRRRRWTSCPRSCAARAATLGPRPASETEPLLAELLAALERRLAEPPETTLAAWAAARRAQRAADLLAATGRARQRSHREAASPRGIDGDGRLVVALDGGGRTALGAGEVHLLPGR